MQSTNQDKTKHSVERRTIMLTVHHPLRKQWRSLLLLGAVFGSLFSSPAAFAAERARAVLFLSGEELQRVVSRPSALSLSPDWHLAPSFEGQEQATAAAQASSVAQNLHWGTGLGIDSYTHLGTRPLWGY